jgi:hypothetical protein
MLYKAGLLLQQASSHPELYGELHTETELP